MVKIERVIFIFKKDEDNLVNKIVSKNLSLTIIKTLFKGKNDAPRRKWNIY